MKFLSSILMVVALATAAFGQVLPDEPTAEVDKYEIGRWGNRVVVAGEGPRAGEEVLFTAAMAPPEDVNDMWFITVWGPSTDPATKALVDAFEKDANLTMFTATPPGEKKAWAHFNWIKSDDPTQKFRFEQFKIPTTGPFPAVMLNPPRDQKFWLTIDGKKAPVCVDIINAKDTGNPAAIKQRIINSVGLYCKKLNKEGHAGLFASSGSHGQQPPGVQSSDEIKATFHGAITDLPPEWNGMEPPKYRDFNPMWQPQPDQPNTPVGPPAPLTMDQILQLCPDAPLEFIQKAVADKVSDPAALKLAWELWKKEHPGALNRFLSWLPTLLGVGFGGFGFVGVVLFVVIALRSVLARVPGNQPGEQTLLPLLQQLLERLKKEPEPPPVQTTVAASAPVPGPAQVHHPMFNPAPGQAPMMMMMVPAPVQAESAPAPTKRKGS